MKKKVKGSRPWSRVLATQALYQLSLNKNIDISMVKKNLLKDKETRNVPDKIFSVSKVPYTKSGKKVEIIVYKIINGEEVNNLNSLRNPSEVDEYYQFKNI